MTQVRWFLACALTLGVGGLASAQDGPASAKPQGSCPACCQDCPAVIATKPCCAVWQFVLRLGGVGVGVAAKSAPAACCTSACAACQKSGSCCDEGVFEKVGQCAPVATTTTTGTMSSCCGTGCCPATQPQTTVSSCPCSSGSCAATHPCTGEQIQCEKVIVLRGTRASFVPAAPVPVSRVAVYGNTVAIEAPNVTSTGQVRSINVQAMESPLQISVHGNQLQIRTPTTIATCDKFTAMPTGPGHVLLEGNVKVICHASHTQTRIESNRIIVDLKNCEFKVMTENGHFPTAQHIGLWYAPSPMPMAFPPAPPIPHFGMPMPTPVSRPVAPAVYQPMPSTSPR